MPLKKLEEDPEDPIAQKLAELRAEMAKKELLKKIDQQENAKQHKRLMKIESVGGAQRQEMKRGGKGLGLTTDHNGNLIQISKRNLKFSHIMAQPDTVVRLVAMDKATKKLAQAAKLRLGEEGQQRMVDRYAEVVRADSGHRSGPSSQANDRVSEQNLPTNIGSKGRGSLLDGPHGAAIPHQDVYAENYLDKPGFG